MKSFENLPLPLRLALRELRGGIRGFRVFLACLILGVGVIAGVGTVTDAVHGSIAEQGRALLAGDVEVRIFQRAASPEERAYFEAAGEVSEITQFRGIVRNPDNAERLLAELKAVDDSYPFYGDLRLSHPAPFDQLYGKLGGRWGAVVDPNLAERLEAGIGDAVVIGEATFEIRSLLEYEPDRSNEGFQLGPTILISNAGVAETNLLLPGSLYYKHYKLRLPPDVALEQWREQLNAAFPDARWRVRDREGSAPGVRRFVDNMGMFLTLVGLMALVVGGVGVGNAVGNYMRGKTPVISTLKILGADSKTIFRTYLTQVMLFAGVAIAVGLALGLSAGIAVTYLIRGLLPFEVQLAIGPLPLVTAAFYGVAVSLMFSLRPLAVAKKVRPVQLMRDIVAGDHEKPDLRYRLYVAALTALVMGLAVALSPWKTMAAGFVLGAAAVLLLLRGAGRLVARLSRHLPRPRSPALRLAISNLHRPGAATAAVVMSLGLGLSLFATVVLVDRNFTHRLNEQVPDQAPTFFMIDIQKQQAGDFRALAESLPGVTSLRLVPSLRGHVTHLDGVPADEAEVDPDSAWVLRGDRVLTYADELPKGNTIVEGEWWAENYSGPPLISFAAEEARDLRLEVGDTVTVNILGRPITATVANLRQLDWSTMDLNFTITFAPGALEATPHTYIASLHARDQAEEEVHRALTDAFPNVTAIRMKEILTSIDNILVQIRGAVNYTGALAILAGILVLSGALAAGYRFRVYDSVIMKILGAVRRDVLKAFVFEYALLGAITGVMALLFGGVSAYLIIVHVMEMEFTLFPLAAAATVLASLVITLVFGMVNTWRALGVKPSRILRDF